MSWLVLVLAAELAAAQYGPVARPAENEVVPPANSGDSRATDYWWQGPDSPFHESTRSAPPAPIDLAANPFLGSAIRSPVPLSSCSSQDTFCVPPDHCNAGLLVHTAPHPHKKGPCITGEVCCKVKKAVQGGYPSLSSTYPSGQVGHPSQSGQNQGHQNQGYQIPQGSQPGSQQGFQNQGSPQQGYQNQGSPQQGSYQNQGNPQQGSYQNQGNPQQGSFQNQGNPQQGSFQNQPSSPSVSFPKPSPQPSHFPSPGSSPSQPSSPGYSPSIPVASSPSVQPSRPSQPEPTYYQPQPAQGEQVYFPREPSTQPAYQPDQPSYQPSSPQPRPSSTHKEPDPQPAVEGPPYPGCAAALKCVDVSYCTLEGVISPTPTQLSREQHHLRVPLTSCQDLVTGLVGKCCRDPNFKPPPGTGLDDGYYRPEQHQTPFKTGFDDGSYKQSGEFDDGVYRQPEQQGQSEYRPQGGYQQPNPQRQPQPGFQQPSQQGGFQQPTPQQSGYQQPTPQRQPQPTPQRQPQPGFQQPTPQQSGFQQPAPQRQPQPGFQQPSQQGSFQQPQQSGFQQPTPQQSGYQQPTPQRQPQPPFLQPPPQSQPQPPFQPPQRQPQPPFLQPPQQSQPAFPPPQQGYQPPQTPSRSPVPTPTDGCGVRKQPVSDENSVTAGPSEFPWQAAVLTSNNGTGLCSAAVISDNAVLTSANCLQGKQAGELEVVVGGERRGVTAVVNHPSYDSGSLAKDEAVLLLDTPLPSQHQVCTGPEGAAGPCFLTGWGRPALRESGPRPSEVHKVEVILVPEAQCQEALRSTYLGKQFVLSEGSLCAVPARHHASFCQIDVGSPLVCLRPDGRYHLLGVYSWDTRCAAPNPAVLAPSDHPWIKQVVTSPLDTVLADQHRHQATPDDFLTKPGLALGYGK